MKINFNFELTNDPENSKIKIDIHTIFDLNNNKEVY